MPSILAFCTQHMCVKHKVQKRANALRVSVSSFIRLNPFANSAGSTFSQAIFFLFAFFSFCFFVLGTLCALRAASQVTINSIISNVNKGLNDGCFRFALLQKQTKPNQMAQE